MEMQVLITGRVSARLAIGMFLFIFLVQGAGTGNWGEISGIIFIISLHHFPPWTVDPFKQSANFSANINNEKMLSWTWEF